jgi:hypothetical protein
MCDKDHFEDDLDKAIRGASRAATSVASLPASAFR